MAVKYERISCASRKEHSDKHINVSVTGVVPSYPNDGLTSIKFPRERHWNYMVEFRCHQPNRFGKSNYNKDSRMYKQSSDSIPIWIKVK